MRRGVRRPYCSPRAKQPTNRPTDQPTDLLTNQPPTQPKNQPTNQPTDQPTNQPTDQPTNQPTLPPRYHEALPSTAAWHAAPRAPTLAARHGRHRGRFRCPGASDTGCQGGPVSRRDGGGAEHCRGGGGGRLARVTDGAQTAAGPRSPTPKGLQGPPVCPLDPPPPNPPPLNRSLGGGC